MAILRHKHHRIAMFVTASTEIILPSEVGGIALAHLRAIQLAHVERAISGILEESWHACFIRPQVCAHRHTPDTGQQVISAGKQRRPRR
jgi:hypothetical protein